MPSEGLKLNREPALLLKIQGMTCVGCAKSIEKAALKVPGVKEAQVDFATETGTFQLTAAGDEAALTSAISAAGYKATKSDDKGTDSDDENRLITKFWWAFAGASALFILAMGPLKGWPNSHANVAMQWVVATPIWLWLGKPFWQAAWRFFRTGDSNMNTLVGLGISAAYFYSCLWVFAPTAAGIWGLNPQVYFEATGFIVAFVYLGKHWEAKAKARAIASLSALVGLSAKKAITKTAAGWQEKPVNEIAKGDVVRVLAGEKIPVDGDVIAGESSVDEAMLTGESAPVAKKLHDQVTAGTLNLSHKLEITARKIGKDTFLAGIVAFVQEAQRNKPPIQRYADKISSVFIPIVLAVALLSLTLWVMIPETPNWGNGLSGMIAVLVVACPCALGLATPMAVIVATSRASLKGMLIKGGEAIEKAGRVNTIVFDKTGTLTQGSPQVIQFEYIEGNQTSKRQLLSDILAIESFSTHPLANALVNYCQREVGDMTHEPDSIAFIAGKGIKAKLGSREYHIGSRQWLNELQVATKSFAAASSAASEVLVACQGYLVAGILIADPIKPQAADVIKRLTARGITTWLLSGDREQATQAVATAVGIKNYGAQCLPQDKAQKIAELQSQGAIVAMIGDGTNDAPALAQANLALAMGSGTDVAIGVADTTMVKGDLVRVEHFLTLSQGTMAIIKQNLFLSLVYNTLLIPIAAGALVVVGGPHLPPSLASIAMGLSSISVVLNSIRVRQLI